MFDVFPCGNRTIVVLKFLYLWITQLRARGRATRGVRAMRLRENDELAAMDIIPVSLMCL